MYGNYGMSTGETITYLFIFFAVAIIIFLIIRALVLWYFRINDLVTQVEITNALLSKLVGVPVPKSKDELEAKTEPLPMMTDNEKEDITRNWTEKDWDRYYETGVMHKKESEQDIKKS